MTRDPESQPEGGVVVDAGSAGRAESFGRYLFRERELRGMSLEHVADATRIGLTHLRAMESDDFSRMPGRVFALGYVRGIARVVGLDPDDAVLRFEEAWRGAFPEGEQVERRPPLRGHSKARPKRHGRVRGKRRRAPVKMLPVLLFFALMLGLLLWSLARFNGQ